MRSINTKAKQVKLAATHERPHVHRKELVEPTQSGSYSYSTEELVAEIGSCFLQSYAGIVKNDMVNSAAYIQGWLGKLRSDKRAVIYASGLAQRGTDYILNVPQSHNMEERQGEEFKQVGHEY